MKKKLLLILSAIIVFFIIITVVAQGLINDEGVIKIGPVDADTLGGFNPSDFTPFNGTIMNNISTQNITPLLNTTYYLGNESFWWNNTFSYIINAFQIFAGEIETEDIDVSDYLNVTGNASFSGPFDTDCMHCDDGDAYFHGEGVFDGNVTAPNIEVMEMLIVHGNSSCTGTAISCGDISDPTLCGWFNHTGQDGCMWRWWYFPEMDCYGTATPCASMSTARCEDQHVCTLTSSPGFSFGADGFDGAISIDGNLSVYGPINATDWTNVSITESQITDLNHFNQTVNDSITDLVFSMNNSEQWNASYLFGYPVTGGIGSGILYAETNKVHCGCINVTDEGGLDVGYPNMTVRIAELDGTTTHCDITEDTVTVTDDQHSVYYVDNACAIQSITFAAYFAQDNNPSDYARLFDVFAMDGDIEMVKGAALIMLTDRKMKWSSVKCGAESHLAVCDGIAVTEATFPYFNQTSGHFRYINSIMTSKAVDSEINKTHLVHHTGGAWTHTEKTEINLSACDDGTNLVTCADNKYRRYIIYSIGQGMHTQIHQLVPLTTDDTYATLGKCLNIEDTAISYTLPANENGIAVIHNIYCGRRDDTSWSGGWIDLREGAAGYGASIDTSIFFTWDDWNVTNTSYVDWTHYNTTNESYVAWAK